MIKGVTRHISGVSNLFTLNVGAVKGYLDQMLTCKKNQLNVYDKAYATAIATSGIYVRLRSTSNPQIGVQFSNIWPFFTF